MTVSLPNLSAGTWNIDSVHSSVGFSVRHLMVSKVKGTFDVFSGVLTVAEDGSASVEATIDVSSLSTKNPDRDAHIRSADFFDVDQFPTATFKSTSVREDGGVYVVTGDFTLHGVTKSIDLRVGFNGVNAGMGQGAVAGFEAEVVLNRKDFGISIDMPLEGGGAVVGDKVNISLEIEAVQQA